MPTESERVNLPIDKETRLRIRKLKRMKENGEPETYKEVLNRILDQLEVDKDEDED